MIVGKGNLVTLTKYVSVNEGENSAYANGSLRLSPSNKKAKNEILRLPYDNTESLRTDFRQENVI
jgi:hypothetical protein